MITVYLGKDIYKITPNENDLYIPESKMDITDRLLLITDIIKSNKDIVIYTNCDYILRHINIHYVITKENHIFCAIDDETGVPFRSMSGEKYYDDEKTYIINTYPEFNTKLLLKDIQIFEISNGNKKQLLVDSYGFTINYFDEIINKQNELQSRLQWEWMT